MAESEDTYSRWADAYDRESDKMQWHGPAVLFGLMYLYLKVGQTVLDLGTGTGLTAVPFHRAGLEVTGLDRSVSMLSQCREKDVVTRIIEHDLESTPWPVDTGRFDHVVSTGVLHFMGDLAGILSEVHRVLKPGGLFGFDVYPFDPANPPAEGTVQGGWCEIVDTEYQERFYRHAEEYISDVLRAQTFTIIRETEFLASQKPKRYFKTIVVKR